MSDAPTLSEETVHVPDIAGTEEAEETLRFGTPSQTSSKDCDAKIEPVSSVEEVHGVSATKIPPANFSDCTVETADGKEENLADGKVCELPRSCIPGLLEEPLSAEPQIQPTVKSANAESPESRDSLASSRHGTVDAPSPLEATIKPPASSDCTDRADGKEEIFEASKLCDSLRTYIPGLLEEPETQPTVSSANSESPRSHDSLASSCHGTVDTPSPLEALRAHLQAMVQDERDFVHTLNSKLTKLEGVVRHVRQEKNSLAAEFQDLEEHVDKLNGGVRAFDAEMRDYSLEKATDNLTEAELRRTESQLSFADIPEIGVNFSTPGQRTRRGLWSRGKRWWRKKSGKVTPEKEDDVRELAADAAIKLEAFLREKL